MEEFLRAKPMLTPLVAGAMVTLITGTLVQNFGVSGARTGLIISFFVGVAVLFDPTVENMGL